MTAMITNVEIYKQALLPNPEADGAQIAYESSLVQDLSSLLKPFGTTILDGRREHKIYNQPFLPYVKANWAEIVYEASLRQDFSHLWKIMGSSIQDGIGRYSIWI